MVTRSRGRRQSKDKDEEAAANAVEEEAPVNKRGRQRKTAAQKKKEAAPDGVADDDALVVPEEESKSVGRKSRGRGKQVKGSNKMGKTEKEDERQELEAPEQVPTAQRGRRSGRQKNSEPLTEQDVGSGDPKQIDEGENRIGKVNAEDMGKLSAAERRKLKKKIRKQVKKLERQEMASKSTKVSNTGNVAKQGFEVEYVSAPMDILLENFKSSAQRDADDGAVQEFSKILQKFGGIEESEIKTLQEHPSAELPEVKKEEEGSSDEEDDKNNEEKISKRKRKELNRIKIGELKLACVLPEVVEVWDVTAADPLMLVHLKSYRNTVPVPRHWSQKRKYLQGKRGLEKPPFKLPAFIEATGIGEMRQAYLEKAEAQKLKAKGRERTQPKMGKLDIDYRILYDAFFRHQTKPHLSGPGDLYFEGKEFEASVTHARPGILSAELHEALGIDPGSPPPWLVAMQRYGPPPSYPSLRIPGLNAPIPPGAQFGYHPGGWGKPPVDEYGNPIYGNVFAEQDDDDDELPAIHVHWGDLEEESEEEEEEEEESEEEEQEEEEETEEEEEADGIASTVSGLAGIETPAEVQIRKGTETPDTGAPKSLYQVLEQRAAHAGPSGIMASDHVYVVPDKTKKLSSAAAKRLEQLKKGMPDDLDISIDPADLESLDDEALRDLYEAKVAEQRLASGKEDFSDLVASKAAAQKRKAEEKAGSKEKKFKF